MMDLSIYKGDIYDSSYAPSLDDLEHPSTLS